MHASCALVFLLSLLFGSAPASADSLFFDAQGASSGNYRRYEQGWNLDELGGRSGKSTGDTYPEMQGSYEKQYASNGDPLWQSGVQHKLDNRNQVGLSRTAWEDLTYDPNDPPYPRDVDRVEIDAAYDGAGRMTMKPGNITSTLISNETGWFRLEFQYDYMNPFSAKRSGSIGRRAAKPPH